MRIQTLRARLSFEAASARLFRPSWRGLFRRRQTGTLADFYVPYFVFTVEAECNGRQERSFWAIDGREGNLSAVSLKRLPDPGDLIEIETTNALRFKIDEARARTILRELLEHRQRRRHGAQAVPELSLTIVIPALRLHWPFWVAAFEQRSLRHLQALDAISGQEQSRKWTEKMLASRRIEARPAGVRPP